jgi:hypothetical protein
MMIVLLNFNLHPIYTIVLKLKDKTRNTVFVPYTWYLVSVIILKFCRQFFHPPDQTTTHTKISGFFVNSYLHFSEVTLAKAVVRIYT